MSGKNGIIIGPWVGEFGWELFSWQGYCRAISKKYEKVIVISRPGNNFLYSDFCDIYLPFEPAEGTADWHMHSSVNDFNLCLSPRSSSQERAGELGHRARFGRYARRHKRQACTMQSEAR